MWALNLVYLDLYCLVRLEPPDRSAPIYHKYIPIFIVYIENARSTSTTTLAFTIATGGTWKIRVAQGGIHKRRRLNFTIF